MASETSQTKQIILNSARDIFSEKGYDGARMQEIADRAGINKALLHYYFTSKEQLFKTVFSEMMGLFIPHLLQTVSGSIPIRDKIGMIVDIYIDFFSKNSFIPVFVIREMTNNPFFFSNYLKNTGVKSDRLIHELMEGFHEKVQKDFVIHLIINTLSLCIFPFAAEPVLKEVLFQGDDNHWKKFIQDRKKTIKEILYNAYSL